MGRRLLQLIWVKTSSYAEMNHIVEPLIMASQETQWEDFMLTE
jgi:hypothetical protein